MSAFDEDDPYTACASCGKQVFAGVAECPYCHQDPTGEFNSCSYCGKRLPVGVAQCPYCKQYTDDGGEAPRQRLPRIYVIAGWLVLICFAGPLLVALIQWLLRRT